MTHYGSFVKNSVVRMYYNTFDGVGASITKAVAGTARCFKDHNLVEDTAGVTDHTDYDTFTGIHFIEVDTSGAFYVAGSQYGVCVTAMTIDGNVVNAWIGSFTLTDAALAEAGDQMDLVNAPNGVAVTAIQAGLAQTGGDGDTLETLSDQIDAIPTSVTLPAVFVGGLCLRKGSNGLYFAVL